MPEILTLEEASKYLRISRDKLYQMARRRKIPTFKVGRTWRFRKVSIDRWLDEQENGGDNNAFY